MKRTGPLSTADAIKQATDDQDKSIKPEETVARVKQKLKEMDLRILDQTFRIDNGRLGIPVFFSTCGEDARALIGSRKQMGKGATPTQAEASAIMELVERFSFFSFYKNQANTRLATANQIGDTAIGFDQIARSVHDQSDDLAVARELFSDLPLRWTGAWNLTQEREMLVPLDWFYAINAFNGASTGNCPAEALCQGLCEVVERHVSSLVSSQRLSVPVIDPGSATDRLVREMLAKYTRAGVQVVISDFTLEMGIPTVAVLAHDPSTFPEKSEIVWTAGTTPSPEKALSRALSEVAQLGGDFNTGANYEASGLPKFSRLEEAAFIIDAPGPVALSTLPDISNPNIRIEVASCVQALAKRGLDVLTVDTMHSELGAPAFYTIVPGAHFRERAAGTSVTMFVAKLTLEHFSLDQATRRLLEMDRQLPGKYFVQFYLGNCHLEMGDPQNALPHFARALDLSPTDQDIPSIYSYMGVCLKDLGDYRAGPGSPRQRQGPGLTTNRHPQSDGILPFHAEGA